MSYLNPSRSKSNLVRLFFVVVSVVFIVAMKHEKHPAFLWLAIVFANLGLFPYSVSRLILVNRASKKSKTKVAR